MPEATTGETPDVPRIQESVKDDLASKIQSSFDAAMGNTDAEDTQPAETTEPAAEVEEGRLHEKTTPEAEAEQPTDSTEPKTDPEAAAPAASTLPAAYVRSLKALEWTDEEIAEAAKQPNFIATAAKLHATRNKEIAAWAELGRKSKQPPAAATETPSTPAADTGLKPVDVKALKEKYGDEALIDALAGPVNRAIEQINSILPVVQQTQTRSQQAQLEMLGRQIDGFFGGKEMAAYSEQYGADSGKLTDQQLSSRTKVLEFADALVGGASQQGRRLSFDEALQMAHDATSGVTKETAARKQITQQMQARQKGITMKPGARGTNLKPAGTRSALEQKVKQGLASALG